jgi:hypothetical protein
MVAQRQIDVKTRLRRLNIFYTNLPATNHARPTRDPLISIGRDEDL